jgi:hypothetical protein
VQDGQKTYWDKQFGVEQPYSSGQQVKRCIIDTFCEELNVSLAPVKFFWDYEMDKAGTKRTYNEGEAISSANPKFPDQLVGGYMQASRKADKKGKKEETDKAEKEKTLVIKRRSPLSISAMRPLHPLLAGLSKENATFDRSSSPSAEVVLRDPEGKAVSLEEMTKLLLADDRSLPKRKFLKDLKRASGLYVSDICIDLRRLFSVSLDPTEPEFHPQIRAELNQAGWIARRNAFGDCLVAPKEMRDQIIPALATALLEWRIGSNQARTFSLMETLAVALSDNANQVAGAIRASLSEEYNRPAAIPVLDLAALAGNPNSLLLAGPTALGYIREVENLVKNDYMNQVREWLITRMFAFDYESQ